MAAKLRLNKAVPLTRYPSASAPDGYASIGNVTIDGDNINITVHIYETQEQADQMIGEPLAYETYQFTQANIEANIIAWLKTQPQFDLATDVV